MVKVFTSNFSFFDGQDIVSSSGEPLAITCSDECLFVAMENCLMEVYSLETRKLVAQLRTISPVAQFVYNRLGDCIVTLESKVQEEARGFARVYFKWRGSSVDKPMRVSMMESLAISTGDGGFSKPQPLDRIAAEIVELPTEMDSSVTCVACCERSGRIVVGMESKVRVFVMEVWGGGGEGRGGGEAAVTHSIEILVDIRTSMAIRKVAISGDFIAFVSSYEARVIKLLLCGDVKSSLGDFRPDGGERERSESESTDEGGSLDPCFIRWSPSLAWDMEDSGRADASHVKPRLPSISSVSLPSVLKAAQQKGRQTSKTVTSKQVLGPVECIWGQPLSLEFSPLVHGSHALTMLYHRFPRGEGRRSRTLGATNFPARGGLRALEEEEEEGGLHSVQLVPTIIEGMLLS